MALLINSELVEDAEIRQEAARLRPQYEAAVGDMDPVEREMQLREWSRENVIERVLLRQEALKDPEPVPPEVIESALQDSAQPGEAPCRTGPEQDELRKEIETRFRIDRLLARVTSKVSPPKHKDVGDYYKKNKEQFRVDETIRAAHIVKHIDEKTDENAAVEAIRGVKAELSNGASFQEVADRHSDCPGGGGDLGWFPRGQMVEEFDEVVFNMKPGEVSDIFRTVFGYHIATVIERRPAGFRDLTEVRSEIEGFLLRQKQEKAVENYLDQLRAKADVKDVKRKAGEQP